MHPAAPHRGFARLFSRYVAWRLRRSFAGMTLVGQANLEAALSLGPTLVLCSHSAWWDPLVLIHLVHRCHALDAYVWMRADSWRRLPFFRHVGAFGVDGSRPADVLAGLRYARALLRATAPRRVVCIYPQGLYRPLTERPWDLRPGAARLARLAQAPPTLPLLVRYEMGAQALPWLYVAWGPMLRAPTEPAAQAAALEAVYAELDAQICGARPWGDAQHLNWAGAGRQDGGRRGRVLAWLMRPRR